MAGGFREFANTKDIRILRKTSSIRNFGRDHQVQLQRRRQGIRRAALSVPGRHGRRAVGRGLHGHAYRSTNSQSGAGSRAALVRDRRWPIRPRCRWPRRLRRRSPDRAPPGGSSHRGLRWRRPGTTTCCSRPKAARAGRLPDRVSPRAALGFRGRRVDISARLPRILPALSGAVGAERVRSAAESWPSASASRPGCRFVSKNSLSRIADDRRSRHPGRASSAVRAS